MIKQSGLSRVFMSL